MLARLMSCLVVMFLSATAFAGNTVTGRVTSLDPGQSIFVVQPDAAGEEAEPIRVTDRTTFSGGLSGIQDVEMGIEVEVAFSRVITFDSQGRPKESTVKIGNVFYTKGVAYADTVTFLSEAIAPVVEPTAAEEAGTEDSDTAVAEVDSANSSKSLLFLFGIVAITLAIFALVILVRKK